jgi:hypothetical protein
MFLLYVVIIVNLAANQMTTGSFTNRENII